jgi:hypothetical protein
MPLTKAQHDIINEIEYQAAHHISVNPTDTLYLIRCIRELEKEATNGND